MWDLLFHFTVRSENFRPNGRRCKYWHDRLARSARNGNPLAARLLGESYLYPFRCTIRYPDMRNFIRAAHWLRLATRYGDYEAYRIYHEWFVASRPGDADYKLALRQLEQPYAVTLLKRAAEHDHGEAIETLIGMYSGGWGRRANAKRREYWRRRQREAAKRGDPQSQFELGLNYELRNRKRARSWYLKAAENGHREAAFKLYSRARDLGISEEERRRWFWRAVELGDRDALLIYSEQFWRNGPTPMFVKLRELAARAFPPPRIEYLDMLHRRQHTDRKPSRVRR